LSDSQAALTSVPLTPIRNAIRELLGAGLALALGWGVIWMVEWSRLAPAWLAAIYITLGREGVFAVFAMMALVIACQAPTTLAEGGWRRTATVLSLLLIAVVVAQIIGWLATGHTTLGILGAVFALLIVWVLWRPARAKPVPRATTRRRAG
jgi:hypothetical protein